MTLIALQILEALGEHPNVTVMQLAEKMSRELEAIRRPTRKLINDGYIKRGQRMKDGSRLRLSGKPFPPVQSYAPAESPNMVRHRHIETGLLTLIPAMRAMVIVGRVEA
ncbi:MarR family transcriptional regulator [Burkholderia cenocepacia]|uniref:MarR family transcriptional regulator n=1 Tax=Burkholderia cenocepacia TaxID=95486 RepID=A0A6B2MMA8_9BURK|nr:helix-turn-helix domain-containing protein [Burkholderia cenocepacia]NDV77058.1 MarR family transcriptional regulator [Burkholderia cenocepacia]